MCVVELYFSALVSCLSSCNSSCLSWFTYSFHKISVPSSVSLVRGSEPCGRVPVLPVERRRHVHHLRPAEGQKHFGVALQPGLPLLLHLPVHLHGAVALHRPHHRILRDHQGTFKSSRATKGSSVIENPWESPSTPLTVWDLMSASYCERIGDHLTAKMSQKPKHIMPLYRNANYILHYQVRKWS